MLYLFGLLDLWTAAIMPVIAMGWVSGEIAIVHAGYLFLKGFIFWGDILSFIDAGVGLYLLAATLGFNIWIITIASVIYLIVKSSMSLK